ncbi:hypothetical protein KP509_24G054500 [Ceratopteris richardii]|uniref:Pentatricopeptide repeat-containing protein n=1 Tax=Ceratopteris richardii TaxID=49495 RepID=A0A8T2RUS8_CERRI|nr:hypothetical protein KP509_24G054500 [Ceratopteris richardii]
MSQKLHYAPYIPNKQSNQNGSTRSSIIMDFVRSGKLQNALTLYDRLQNDATAYPCVHTYAALLKACAKLKRLYTGLIIHHNVAITGQAWKSMCIASGLINMYAECGSLLDAQQVFNSLPVRNAVCWNALMTAYARHGYGEEALMAFDNMLEEGIDPTAVAYINVLKACAILGCVTRAQGMHAEFERTGLLGKDVSIGNTLLHMYAKCGLIAKAQEVFDRLVNPNLISWNALMTGCSEQGYHGEVRHIFDRMQSRKICPDAITLICVLKACGILGESVTFGTIHAEAERKGLLEKDFVIVNTIIDNYIKLDMVSKAWQVLNRLPVEDVMAWNALISSCVKHGLHKEALEYLKQMQSENVSPDSVTYVWGLKACGGLEDLSEGQELHVEIERRNMLVDNHFLGSALVDMYSKSGSLAKARQVFESLRIRNVVTWTALISGYVEHSDGEQALDCFKQMQSAAIPANAFTYAEVVRACGSLRDAEQGRIFHAEIVRLGLLQSSIIVGSTLVDMYSKCGLIWKAKQVFDMLSKRDVIAWTSLATAYAENGQAEESLYMIEQMQHDGISSDEVALVCSLKICGIVGATSKGIDIHAELVRKGLLGGLVLENALVDMYSKCGELSLAQETFDRLPCQDVACWNSLIAAYALYRDGAWSFEIFDKMLSVGIFPDTITFSIILNVCGLVGLFAKGHALFDAMSELYGITPTVEHHNCMVDIHCRAGFIDKALALIEPFSDAVTHRSILGACKKWGSVEGGLQTFEIKSINKFEGY